MTAIEAQCFYSCLIDGSSGHGLDGLLAYPQLHRQQLLALDPNIYGADQFRHGLTPPQLGPDQMHAYGEFKVEGLLTYTQSLDCLIA